MSDNSTPAPQPSPSTTPIAANPTPHFSIHHHAPKPQPALPQKPLKERMWEFYAAQYKKLLIIPLLLILISLGIITAHYIQTGDALVRDVSLKGGATITIPLENPLDIQLLENDLLSRLPEREITVRGFGIAGQQQGVIVSADININDKDQLNSLLLALSQSLNKELADTDYGIEFFGSSLGASFFRESIIIMLVAFGLMALVVFAYFRTFIPSIAILLAAVGDMVVALAFIDLFDIPIGTAGIAAFLMLIGYSVDTDILLTIRVLKRKEGTVDDRIASSIKTGTTQTAIAILAMALGFFMAQSDIIRQIMLILMVGLTADLVFTWIQNVSILRYYLERKERKRAE